MDPRQRGCPPSGPGARRSHTASAPLPGSPAARRYMLQHDLVAEEERNEVHDSGHHEGHGHPARCPRGASPRPGTAGQGGQEHCRLHHVHGFNLRPRRGGRNWPRPGPATGEILAADGVRPRARGRGPAPHPGGARRAAARRGRGMGARDRGAGDVQPLRRGRPPDRRRGDGLDAAGAHHPGRRAGPARSSPTTGSGTGRGTRGGRCRRCWTSSRGCARRTSRRARRRGGSVPISSTCRADIPASAP